MTDELINTLEAPGEFDALPSLGPGEPYFLLCGRDRFAPELVQRWADHNRQRALKERDDGLIDKATSDRELRKSTQAEEIGWAMKAYKRGDEAKSAAVVEKATYTGHQLPEETKRRDKIQSAKIHCVTALNNAVAELCDLQELDTVAFNEICLLAQCGPRDLQRLSEAVKPKRPGIDK